MKCKIQAACGCHIGKVRKNNEDNFFFDGVCLNRDNNGLPRPIWFEEPLHDGLCLSVFDGMGGENFGEYASYAAARQLLRVEKEFTQNFIPTTACIDSLAEDLNTAVTHAQHQMRTDKMGTTLVGLYFSGRHVYICNVGDSRAYRLRDGRLTQISIDHVEKRPGRESKKAPLTQHLGLDAEEIQIEPYVVKERFQKGDRYLLCSDGVTDMLTDSEISDIMLHSKRADLCVCALIEAALEHGGRDNTTAIVCKLI